MRLCSRISVLGSLFAAIALAQAPSFTVQMGDKPAVTMTAEDLAKLPQHTVSATEHGKNVSYSGVLLHDVLQRAGAPFGNELKGKVLSTYVLATARDGYAVVFALADFEPSITDSDVIVATSGEGKPLTENQGPFRIVAPHDKKPARSLRMLTELQVAQLKK